MRIGIVARGEDRGIGIQTWEAARHLDPAAVLCVNPGVYGQGFPNHWDRFDALHQFHADWARDYTLDIGILRAFLDFVDVCYVVETAYDARFYDLAREHGVATVLHTNPELHRPEEASQATQVWLPTPWRAQEVTWFTGGPVPRLVPYPVAAERWEYPNGLYESPPLRVLHVAGHAAYADRNGTKLVAVAMRDLDPALVEVTVVSQDENVAVGPNALRAHATANYWDLYDGYHALLMPRRFGGLCLPIQEAKAAGLAVVGLAVEPADYYDVLGVEADMASHFETGSGRVPIANTDPRRLAAALTYLALHPDTTRQQQRRSRAWARTHSWDALGHGWQEELRNAWSAHLDS
jgi:hypothetical protein